MLQGLDSLTQDLHGISPPRGAPTGGWLRAQPHRATLSTGRRL